MRPRPKVLSVGTAVPENVLRQEDARAFAKGFFAEDFPALDRLLDAFGNTEIERRYLARPLDWYDEPHGFPKKNEIYAEVALGLAERACREAVERAGLSPAEIRGLLFVSSTGLATPSLDSYLIQRLDLPRDLARTPIWGLGCAGGGAGVARAASLATALEAPVLLVASELCSTTFVHEDRSKANLIATALFGDGAAAAVIAPTAARGPEIVAGLSHLIDGSEEVMGWSLRETGLQVRFARSIPAIVRELGPSLLDQARTLAGEEMRHVVLHPGGAKVLAAYKESLGLCDGSIELAGEVLRNYGNMSSPTVLFVLERFMQEVEPSGEAGLLLGLGPGFCAEGAVFRW